jgi:hypothetical protein
VVFVCCYNNADAGVDGEKIRERIPRDMREAEETSARQEGKGK